MIYNRLFHNRFLREEAIPGSEGEGPGGGAPPPASPVDSPPPSAPELMLESIVKLPQSCVLPEFREKDLSMSTFPKTKAPPVLLLRVPVPFRTNWSTFL